MCAQCDDPGHENLDAANDAAAHEPLFQAMIEALYAVAEVMGHPCAMPAAPPSRLAHASQGGRR